MPPLEARRVEVIPKSQEEQRKEAELHRREAQAYAKAASVTFRPKKRANPESVKTIYQTGKQEGTDTYTRAWLEQWADEAHTIFVHTDAVTDGNRGAERDPAEHGTERVSLSPEGVGVIGEEYRDLNVDQKLGVMEDIEATLTYIAEESAAQAIREA